MINNKKVRLFGVSMHAWSMEHTVQVIRERIMQGQFTQHVVVNVAKLVNMQSDAVLAASVLSSDIINIDGFGVAASGRIFGLDIPERVTGIDLFYRLLSMAEEEHRPVYFLGAIDAVIEATMKQILCNYPQLEVAGFHNGYFWDNEEDVVQEIAASGAEMLFVAISSPHKENFINKWKTRLNVKFVMGVGGTFDVVAGKVKRAPLWMQSCGFEWLWRVMQEPGRLWKRYLISNSKFLYMMVRGAMDSAYRKDGTLHPSSENTQSMHDTINMFDLSFNATTLNQAVELVVNAGIERKKGLVVTPNVDHLVKLQKDKLMRDVFHAAMFRFADGMPLVWFSRLFMASSLPGRVTGADLLPAVATQAAYKGVKLFLCGGNPGVASLAAEKLIQTNPGLEIVGTYCPPFGFEHDAEESLRIVNMINTSGADILFVGVGAPKQEKWAYQYFDQLQVGPILGVGAALDFSAGTIVRCPRFLQSIGAEWLYRLASDPKRLWRRYLVDDVKFLGLAFAEWRKVKRQKRIEPR